MSLKLRVVNEVLVNGQVRVECLLKDGVADVVDLLVAVLRKEVREGLESAIVDVKATVRQLESLSRHARDCESLTEGAHPNPGTCSLILQ